MLDHIGRLVRLAQPPKRIVSLCPSLTETLYALGLDHHIVGRTRFCIHPKDSVSHAVRVGGTKEINMERLKSLSPDLIIAEKEENTKEMVEVLEKEYPVFVGDVKTVQGGIKMIQDMSQLTATQTRGKTLVEEINREMNDLPDLNGSRVLYFIWKDPWMVVGADTYIHDFLQLIKLKNVGAQLEGRYPSSDLKSLQDLNPAFVWLSSEPYPFKEKHVEELRDIFPDADISCVDGEMFSWYGSRMKEAFPYVRELASSLIDKP